jgi:NADPH-dependent ferric siderophore reductase
LRIDDDEIDQRSLHRARMMGAIEPTALSGRRMPGRLDRALIRLLMKPATIVASEEVAKGFRLVTMEGPALQGVAWTPGQKVQIAMGSAFVARTYTPIEWNPVAGRACILGVTHDGGPGSRWLSDIAPGDRCDVFGPRTSLSLDRMPGPLVICGDETSLGLAYAAVYHLAGWDVSILLEVADPERAQQVAAALGLRHIALVARRADDSHLPAMADMLLDQAGRGASFALTGRAQAIQALRRALKARQVPSARIATKAYWAPGKTGLD